MIGDVHLDLLLRNRRQLRHGHLESAVPDDCPDLGVRTREFGADRRPEGANPIVPSPPEVINVRGSSCL